LTALFDFSQFPTLTTRRLLLRELDVSDAPDVFIFRSDAYVQRFNDVPMTDVAEARELIEWLKERQAEEKRLIWGITLHGKNRVLGMCGFNYWNRDHRRADIGYDLARDYWSQGIMSEALRAMLQFGFEQMNLHRIEAETIVDNTESVRLLERLGFIREGLRREYSWEDDGQFHGSTIYGLLRHEFLKG
jgi:[ribosomal protein S5]-alanine N-acetyltransferase